MTTFKDLYYIENTAWQRKNDLTKIKKFDDISYNDCIIFHFDFAYSVLKTSQKAKQSVSNNIFISAINICLRFHRLIKQLYPYNKVFIILHCKDIKTSSKIIDKTTLKSVVDIIPKFAVVSKDDYSSLSYYNQQCYKHIFYGKFLGTNIQNILNMKSNKQIWSLSNGKLIVRSN